MKRYEELNKILKENKSAEMQSFEMIIAHIRENYSIDDDLNWWLDRYKAQLKWLNEEVK